MTQHYKCKAGLKLRIESDDPRVLKALSEYYEQHSWHSWECPFCQSDIDSLSYDKSDGMFEDTYTCKGECDALITFISPDGEAYHEVFDSDMTIMIEFMHGGTPATWDNDEDEAGKMPPYETDQPIAVDPDQLSFL